MSGSTAGGIVGGLIGAYVGGAQGAQIGWMVGSAVGGYVDPDVIKGPRLRDAQTQTSMEGAPRPIVYGVAVVAGNIIQTGPLVEHEHEDRSGKGGPVQQTFTYTRTYAIRVCEGPVAGIRRIWRNDKLVYDLRDPDNPDDGVEDAAKWASDIRALAADTGKFASHLTIYLGDEEQMPDPSLEALPAINGGGIGNVPAYRGSCYVVLVDDDLTDLQGAVPQYRFEVAAAGSVDHIVNDYAVFASLKGSSEMLVGPSYSDLTGTIDTGFAFSGPQTLVTSLAGLVFQLGVGVGGVSYDRGTTWTPITGLPASDPNALVYSTSSRRFYLVVDDGLYVSNNGLTFSQDTSATIPGVAESALVVSSINGDTVLIGGSGFILRGGGGWEQTFDEVGEVRAMAAVGSTIVAVGTVGIRVSSDLGATWSGTKTNPMAANPIGVAYGNGQFLIVDSIGNVATSSDNGENWTLRDALPEGMGTVSPQGEVTFDGGNAFLVATQRHIYSSINGDDWVEQAAVDLTGEIMSITSLNFYGADAIPDIPDYYVVNGSVTGSSPGSVVTPVPTYLDEVVLDIADRVGVTASQVDASQLSDIRVRGFVVNGRAGSSASDAIRSLQPAYNFDFPEWGDWPDTSTKLRGILRGGDTAFAITSDDLVQSDDDEDTRAQAVEFPRKINLISSDPAADYNPTKQTAERRTENVKAVGESSLELPLVLTRDEAAQKADIMLKIAWEEAVGRWERELPEEFSQIVPSDCFTFDSKRYRATECEYGDGSVKVKAVRDRASAYTSNATGGTALPPASPVGVIRGPTIFAGFNSPQLRSQDTSPGVYVAACGLLPGWSGCDLQISYDDGVTFTSVLTMTRRATLGYLTDDCTSSSEPIAVALQGGGELQSVTDAQIAARANAFGVITSDVVEVAQFKTATETDEGYDLTDITRPELGTDAATHYAGDQFVLLDGAIYFLPIDIAYAGSTLIFRPVSIGTVPANNATYSLVYSPIFTSAPAIDFLTTDTGEVIRAISGEYIQVTE